MMSTEDSTMAITRPEPLIDRILQRLTLARALRDASLAVLLAFGLIPAGVVAASAYLSAQEFMSRQSVMIRQAAVSISEYAKLLVQKNLLADALVASKGVMPAEPEPPAWKWNLTDLDREELERHIRYVLRDFELTERELECLFWIAEGKTSDEIAMILGISRNTINNYITSVMRKTATKTRSEAIAFAVRNNLV